MSIELDLSGPIGCSVFCNELIRIYKMQDISPPTEWPFASE
jgi:hypothetical protein